MALPNLINPAVPLGSEDVSLGDDRIRNLSQAIVDIFGLPSAANIAAALFQATSAGLKSAMFQDAGGVPTSVGMFQRNGNAMQYHDGVGVKTLATTAVAGGQVALAGVMQGPGTNGLYTTSNASWVDVDSTNLKRTLAIPAGAKFLIVWASVPLFVNPNTITDNQTHLRFLASGVGFSENGWVRSSDSGGVYTYNVLNWWGVLANPTSGNQTLALQYRADTVLFGQPIYVEDSATDFLRIAGTVVAEATRVHMFYLVTT